VKPRIDPSSRLVLEERVLPLVCPTAVAAGGFVELCARTSFSGITIEGYGAVEGRSLLDARAAWPGAGLPEEVVARAALLGQQVVAIADVDTVAGVVRAHAAGRELGVRVIPGCELLLDEGSLVLLPIGPRGWSNLCAILTHARDGTLQRGLQKDDVDHRLDVVLACSDDLMAIAWPPFADDALLRVREAFGDRLSVGVTLQDVPEDHVGLAFAGRWASRGVPVVLSARPLLVDAADRRFHDVLCALRQHRLVDRAGQRLLPNSVARMRSHDELRAHAMARVDAGLVDRWLARARAIADACAFQLGQIKYAFPVDDEDPDRLLRSRVFAGARERYPRGVPDDVRAQLEHELAIVADIDVAPYFLTVKDIVDVARARGILCQGRGSAANSAICFCLGVTSIDPVRMGLFFERFLSKERGEPPDIDVDFEHERREEVIQDIYARWGRDHAAMVAEVISFRGRSAVREVGKVHGLSDVVTGRLAEQMMHGSPGELACIHAGHGGGQRAGRSERNKRGGAESLARRVGVDVDDPAVRRTLEMAMRLQGHPRHLGIHSGGFVLTRQRITELAPVEPARMPGRAVLPWDKDDVDELGLFKMDVLGLGMLTCIRKALALVNERSTSEAASTPAADGSSEPTGGTHGATAQAAKTKQTDPRPPAFTHPLALHTIPAEDPAVYDALCAADTIGVFQVESRAQMSMLPRLKPRSFYDLVVEVAIIRPGPIQGGMVHPYLRRRSGEEPVSYPHEALRPILERTLGVPLFQEQVMKIAVVGAGYSPGEADQLRRDMAAWRKSGRLERHRQRLIDGFRKTGVDVDFAQRLYEQIKGFGEYGFPESHAASFAILVYASAWLKRWFPAEFACALLNSLPMGFYAPSQIVADAQRHAVTVRAVDVNASDWDCTLERDDDESPALRLGLRIVKGLRHDVIAGLVVERARSGPFKDVADVVRRARLDKRARLALARSGAFDLLAGHRRAALWAALDPRPPLFASLRDDAPPLSAPTQGELLLLDYAHTGLSVDDHPMRHVRPELLARLAARVVGRRTPPLLDARGVADARHGTRALVAGLVTGRQRPGTADGTCFVTLEDEHGQVNVIVWGRDFDRWRTTIVGARFLLVDAVIERQGIVVHAIARAVAAVTPSAHAFGVAGGVVEAAGPAGAQLALPFASRDFR
jgi:error-prone DNA polymerase